MSAFGAHPFEAAARSALARFQGGDLAGAKRQFTELLGRSPGHPEVLQMLGLICARQGDYRDAVRHFEKSLQSAPGSPVVHYNLGTTLMSMERHGEAIRHFQASLKGRPQDHDTHNNLGICLLETKRFAEAETVFAALVGMTPSSDQANYHLGCALMGLKRHGDAVAPLRRALDRGAPNAADIRCELGVALLELKHPEAAIAELQAALASEPDNAQAHRFLGEALIELAMARDDGGAAKQGRHHFARALALRPGHPATLLDFADGLFDLNAFEEAAGIYAQVLTLNPNHPEAAFGLACSRRYLCDWRDLARLERRALDLVARQRARVAPFAALFLVDDPGQHLKIAERFAADFVTPALAPRLPPTGPVTAAKSTQRLRLGYLSSDLHHHATALLTAELFELHDRNRFEVQAFSYGPDRDSPMRRRLVAAFDRFHDVRAQGDFAVAELIRDQGIDILIDLKGFTQNARFGILTRRPAPIQIAYLGYPGSMGSDAIDYMIADTVVCPAGADRFYREKIVRLPHSYQANDRQRQTAPDAGTRGSHGLPERGFVFCCFNNAHKITPAVFEIWTRLLAAVPDSVLWLYAKEASVQANLRREAASRAIAPERLVFAPMVPNAEHLARLGHADLVLDTLPYNAHTTASDALWAGVPVVTCAGQSFAARVAGSLLQAAQLPELITTRLSDYEAMALKLATNPDLLAGYRRRLAHGRLAVPLFDTPKFCRALEGAYLQMWQRLQSGQPPAAITWTAE